MRLGQGSYCWQQSIRVITESRGRTQKATRKRGLETRHSESRTRFLADMIQCRVARCKPWAEVKSGQYYPPHLGRLFVSTSGEAVPDSVKGADPLEAQAGKASQIQY